MEVLSPATAVWMCPECGHGSSEIRDERAHLDAHRQLRAFFQEWDAGTESGQQRGRRSRRRLVLLYSAVAVLVVLLSVVLFSRINGESGERQSGVPTIVVPEATAIPQSPPPTVAPARVADPVTASVPSPGRATSVSPPAPAKTSADNSFAPPKASAAGEPQRPAVAATVSPQPVAPAAPHLLHLCLLNICLTAL